jgi:hypothetical protein
MGRKVKYDYAFKIGCMKLFIEQSHSVESVSAQKGVHELIIRNRLRF